VCGAAGSAHSESCMSLELIDVEALAPTLASTCMAAPILDLCGACADTRSVWRLCHKQQSQTSNATHTPDNKPTQPITLSPVDRTQPITLSPVAFNEHYHYQSSPQHSEHLMLQALLQATINANSQTLHRFRTLGILIQLQTRNMRQAAKAARHVAEPNNSETTVPC